MNRAKKLGGGGGGGGRDRGDSGDCVSSKSEDLCSRFVLFALVPFLTWPFFSLFLVLVLVSMLFFFMMTVLCCRAAVAGAGVGMVAVDENGDLSIAPLARGAVLVQGVDVPASLVAIHGRLRALETGLQIAAGPMPASPARPLATDGVPRVGQDPLGNLLLIPATSTKTC
jgi:hypothetical protein